jgi:mRNA-degrading endonuclease RelE of RelBE toxin-antitoxin system
MSYSLLILPEFLASASELPKDIRAKIIKCLNLLSTDIRHSGLQTRKIEGSAASVYECRVDRNIRLIYDLYNQSIRCWFVGAHDIALQYGEKKVIPTKGFFVDDICVATEGDSSFQIQQYLTTGRTTINFVSFEVDDISKHWENGSKKTKDAFNQY